MDIVLALAGNQNCGKTTLFNALTGSNQHVGNFPGVTVEKKEGRLRDNARAVLVDLPGIYSLSPYTAEEVVTRDYLLNARPDAIINIVDATNLERSLYLTLQLMDLGIPMVLALNMMDEVRANGYCIDVEGLTRELGVPAFPIAANRGEGIAALAKAATSAAQRGQSGSGLVKSEKTEKQRKESGVNPVANSGAARFQKSGDEKQGRTQKVDPPNETRRGRTQNIRNSPIETKFGRTQKVADPPNETRRGKTQNVCNSPIEAKFGKAQKSVAPPIQAAPINGSAARDLCRGPVRDCVLAVERQIAAKAKKNGVPLRYAAIRLLEGDPPTEKRLGLNERETEALSDAVRALERAAGTDREAAVADMRYTCIDAVCRRCVRKGAPSKEHRRSVRIDRFLTGKYTALPAFLAIMLTLFWLTFGPVGGTLSRLMETGVNRLAGAADALLFRLGTAPLLHSLIVDGVFAGVGSVLSFLPTILVLFFLLSILEDTGYMARVAFFMDALMRGLGLSGRSFVPMLIGFGCSVPAVMAARTLPSERDRKMTILLVPFLSCSAKLPIYAMFTQLFFAEHRALVLLGLYLLGMLAGVLYGLFFKNTILRSDPVPFVMELPAYRLPSAKNIARLIGQRAKEFLTKAFTVIFLASIVIWFLQRFSFSLTPVGASDSMLAEIGRRAAPLFAPLGFTDWRVTAALLTGLTAKEAVVSTLTVLTGAQAGGVMAAVRAMFTPASACAFLAFTLLYMPCVAAVTAIKRELGSGLSAALAMLSQTGIAWLTAYCVYRAALLLGG